MTWTNGRNGNAAYLGALGVLVLGGAAGYIAGLLSAPASGRETRRRIGQRVEDEREEVMRRGRRAVDGAADRLGRSIHAGRRKLKRRLVA